MRPCKVRGHRNLLLLSCTALLVFLPSLLAGPVALPPTKELPPPENYDIRIHGRPALDILAEGYGRDLLRGMADAAAGRIERASAITRLRDETPGNEVRMSEMVGGTEVVRNSRGALTAPALGGDATDIALGFLRSHAPAYGLTSRQVDQFERLGVSLSRGSGLRMVRLHQKVGGLRVFQADTRIILDREGRVVRTVGRIVPGVDESRVPSAERRISAAEALRSALLSVGMSVDLSQLEVRRTGRETWPFEVVSSDPRIARPVSSRLTYFPLGPGVLVPAWEQGTLAEGLQGWITVVDARTGTLLFRKNIRHDLSTEPARFAVYARPDGTPLENPAPGSPNYLLPGSGTQFPTVPRTIISMLEVQDPIASPDGWIPDGGDTTVGNNAYVYIQPYVMVEPGEDVLDGYGRPIGNPDALGNNRDFLGSSPRDFNYSPPPLDLNPDAGDSPIIPNFQRGAVTHLFYLLNYWHDWAYRLGFDEAAGNFQESNFGRGGLEGDLVYAATQYAYLESITAGGGGIFVFPDGMSSVMQLSLWGSPEPYRDGALDSVPLHEMTHGLTSRLLGDTAGMSWAVSRCMGEGWSDFFSISMTHQAAGEDPDGQYAVGSYATYGLMTPSYPYPGFADNYVYGIRAFPLSTDNLVNPVTWADADLLTADYSGGIPPSPFNWQSYPPQIHAVGFIWATTLWEVRSRIIAAHGGDVPFGNELILQIIVDSLKMLPIDPGFIEAREAMIDADCAANACANEESIWGGFSDRGLGYKSHASLAFAKKVGVKESFSTPYLDALPPVIDDSQGNGNGFVDPGETVSIQVPLINPWRNASKGVPSAHAVLTSENPGVLISDSTSDYGSIPAGGTGLGDSFTLTLGPGAACGSSLQFTLATTSSLGEAAASFALRVGRPAGTGAPVELVRAIPEGLSIPDARSSGVTDNLIIDQDLEIADLDFRVDNLTHTWVGDLTIYLRGPDGLGLDVISSLATCTPPFPVSDYHGCWAGGNAGDNFINTVIDDDSPRDLWSVGEKAAPFTGDWMSYANSPSLEKKYTLPTDPVGQLSHFAGQSTRGTWQLNVADLGYDDAGTLNSWSLVVTPVAYECGP